MTKKAQNRIQDMAAASIMMPMLQNRWKIESISTLTPEELDMVCLQAISIGYKFNAGTDRFGFHIPERHDLSLLIEEPVNGMIAPIVAKLMNSPFDLTYVHLDGDVTALKRTTFIGCRGVGYRYQMDYSVSASCKYPLKFKCEKIIYS